MSDRLLSQPVIEVLNSLHSLAEKCPIPSVDEQVDFGQVYVPMLLVGVTQYG